ncbi:hypothetical protein LTR05_001185 [Lithohypha guttulata]|uniref:Uncharacterized protein n=1 Tax=Lithohypha guttulata TaxID=1690604 RepID=A0AAN7YAB4_9EURO|nr:hypothetical protein LTR05_001185 [Lithohypha guttulata]
MPEKVYLAIKRKKREPKGLDQPGKEAYRSRIWHEIFQAIFPDRRCPESPYMNNQECVLHLYNIFVTLGPIAQFVYNSLLISQTGIPLPEMTRDVVHEAYTVFLEEFGETYLAGTAGTTSSPLYHDQIPEVSITPFTSPPLILSDSDYSTQSSSSQPLSQDPCRFSQFTDNEPSSESVPTYRPNFTHNVPDHANLDFYASQSIASTPDNQSNIAIYTPDLNAITDSLCDEALSTRHDTSSFDIFECMRNRFAGGSMHEVLCSEVAATAPALAA